jgi:hypothetical protein
VSIKGKLESLEDEYQRKRAEIRSDKCLSWLKQEMAIKALGDEHYSRRRELEDAATKTNEQANA